MKYIDVSEHQGVIDWARAKESIDGAILRAGYGRSAADRQFRRNAAECNRLGIPCGAYWFSYAYSPEMARSEAAQLLRAVGEYEMALPLAFDYEYDSVTHGRQQGAVITPELVRDMASEFCRSVEEAGYRCLLYANPDFLSRYFGALPERCELWLAQWPKTVDLAKPPRACGIWQWGVSAVPGISGQVDTNEAYRDYAGEMPGASPRPTGEPSGDSVGEGLAPPAPTEPWYAEAMAWARGNGIMDGLRPEDPATRAEVAQMFYNLEKGRRKP